jgi:hypothetical protein
MQRLLRIVSPLLFSLLLIPQVFAAQEIGNISEVTGGVDILRAGKLPAEPAKVGEKIAQGDIIRTKSGGKAQVQFKDDSVLTIAPDSRVALNEYVYEPEKNQRQASIKIFQGLVHTVVNKVFNKEKPDFTVETQTAVIGVRGTDYYTLVGPAISDIYNNSGTTEVRNIFAEIPGKVKLQGKEFTQVGKNLPPTLPLPLTTDDINWIKGQMVPKMVARPSGTGTVSSQAQLMSNVGGNAVQTQTTATTASTLPGQPNIIQNIQSAVYVPPQPAPIPPTLPIPFNIAITWGSGAQDLDLYLTVPNGSTQTVYYGNQGSSTTQPYAFYHYDSAVKNGGEVITVSRWNTGGTYTAYVQDFTNQGNPSSTVLSSSSAVTMQFLRGGTVSVVPVSTGGNKAIVTGGTPFGTLSSISPSSGLAGNNWTAVSINPSTGVITPINTIGPFINPITTTSSTTTTISSTVARTSPPPVVSQTSTTAR